MSRANLRKNPLIPSHALTNLGHADPVHRFPHERPLVLGLPRNEDDNPVAVECFHLNVVQEGKPSSVSGGVGGVVEEDFKIHMIFPKRFVVCYIPIIIYIGIFVKGNQGKTIILLEKSILFLPPCQGVAGGAASILSIANPIFLNFLYTPNLKPFSSR